MTDSAGSAGKIDRFVVPVLGLFAAVVLFALMLLTCVDVVGRYFFNQPVTGGFEITEMLLAALIFCGLPMVTLRNDHVTVDILDGITPDWLFRIEHVVASLIGFVATGYLAWRLWVRAVSMDIAGETTAQLKFKLAYLTYGMSILMAFTALALLLLAFRRPERHLTAEV
ncbi:MAG: TRAP transporter small permease [Proteobacteria bacterium]|nr:TRAP transporter small permease [Pseudomonadota bacterium]